MYREKVLLPVVDVRKYPQKWYYIVEYDKRQYQVGMIPYQRNETEIPSKLACLIEHNSETGGVYIKQNFEPLLAERYKEGEYYDFTIDDDYTNTSTPHYKVSDGSGFWFKLYRSKGFNRGEMVRCRVTRVNGISVSLEAVEKIESHDEPTLDPGVLREAMGDEFSVVEQFISGNPAADEAKAMLAKGDYRWLSAMLDAVWAQTLETARTDTAIARNIARLLRNIIIYILEDSEYLNTLSASNRSESQSQLSLMAARAEDLIKAAEMVDNGTEQEFIDSVLSKMSASGYLYHPEQKLRIMMYVFAMRKESIDTNMEKLLEVIYRGRQENWNAEPFRSAFVTQLELYIDGNHTELDTLTGIDTPRDRDRLEKMLQALAIQQLLYSDADASVDPLLNRSRLYRYFTFASRFEQDLLLNKALTTVRSRSRQQDEFRWNDTPHIETMASRLLNTPHGSATSLSFDSPAGIFTAAPQNLTIASDPMASRQVLPIGLGLWQNLNVCLNDQLPAPLRQPVTVSDYKKVWVEIERSFFAPAADEQNSDSGKRIPDVGEEVSVIIDGNDPDDALSMHVTIVDDLYCGQGWVTMKEVTNMERQAPLSSFRNAQGEPYLLRAEVRGNNDGVLTFSLRPPIGRMLYDIVQPDDEVNCVITYSDPRSNRYIAFSENGYSLFIDPGEFQGQLRRSLNIRARVTYVRPDGLTVNGRCISINGPAIDYADSVQVLMASLSEEEVAPNHTYAAPMALTASEEDVDARSADDMMTDSEMTEIMRIVGRKGDVENDLVKRYNYHAFARLMALMLDLKAEADYYRRRCAVIEVLDDFATNGQVDPTRLETVSREQKDTLTSTLDGRKLLTLAMLDRTDANESLWRQVVAADSNQLSTLARLVLAYNLLDGFKMGEERGRIRTEIYTLLNLRRDVQPEQIEQGMESQKVEFKTSMVYPPGPRVRVDIPAQTAEIVEKIVGMLNADGGRIYVGVSDEGYIRGLANDLNVLGSRDKMELTLRNAITRHCGFIPNGNNHIVTSWETRGDKELYIVDITPIYDPVAFDGVYYQRQGTSNRFVPNNQVNQFIAARHGNPSGTHINTTHTKAVVQEAATVAEHKPASAPALTATSPVAEPPSTQPELKEGVILTSQSRSNVLHDGFEGYRPVSAWLYFMPDDSLTVSDTDQWTEDDSLLTIALNETELEDELLMVYKSGSVAVAPMRFAIKNFEKEPRRLRKNDPLLFASPLKAGDGLIVYSRDTMGNLYKQAFRPDSLPKVSMLKGLGQNLMKGTTPVWAEVIPAERLVMFSGIMRNAQKVKASLADDVAGNTAPRLGFDVNIS